MKGEDIVLVHQHGRVEDWLGPMKTIIDNLPSPHGFSFSPVVYRRPEEDTFYFPSNWLYDAAPKQPATEIYARQSRSASRRYQPGMPALHPTKGYRRAHKNFRGGSR